MANNKMGGGQKPPSDEAKAKQPTTPSTGTPPKPPVSGARKHPESGKVMTQRQLTRYEKDLRRQRQLTISAILIVVLMVLVLVIGFFQSTIAPNIKEVATVNGQSISSGDYYKFRKLTLFKRVAQFQQILPSLGGDQQQQFQAQISQNLAEIENVTQYPVDQATLEDYAKLLIQAKAAKDEFGIDPSDNDVKQSMDSQFSQELSLSTPTPNSFGKELTPTLAAVETAVANQATATFKAITPLPTPTLSVSPSPTTVASTPTVTVSVTPAISGTPTGTDTAGASPTVSATVAPSATPVPGDKAQQTVSASQNGFFDSFKKATGLSQDDYKALEIKPRLIKTLVSEKLLQKVNKIGDPVLQLRASSIVLKERNEALDIANQLQKASAADLPALVTKLAREKSINSVTAPKNGDLGWFIQYQLSNTATEDKFWDAAVKLNVGQVSGPVNTSDGWEVIYLTGKDEKRALDEKEYQAQFDTDQNGDYRVFVRWLQAKVDAAKPVYKTSPTPTVEPTQVPQAPFTPVVQPTPTPNATATAIVELTLTPQPSATTSIVGPVPVVATPTPANTPTTTSGGATSPTPTR